MDIYADKLTKLQIITEEVNESASDRFYQWYGWWFEKTINSAHPSVQTYQKINFTLSMLELIDSPIILLYCWKTTDFSQKWMFVFSVGLLDLLSIWKFSDDWRLTDEYDLSMRTVKILSFSYSDNDGNDFIKIKGLCWCLQSSKKTLIVELNFILSMQC
jgi:hypothetical protein